MKKNILYTKFIHENNIILVRLSCILLIFKKNKAEITGIRLNFYGKIKK